MTKHEKEGQLGEECEYCKAWEAETGYGKICDHKASEEKKDWEERFDGYYNSLGLDHVTSFGEISNRERIKEFIHEKLKEEREKWRLKNAGLYRQLFGEVNPDKTFTAKALWNMFNDYSPLFTEDQKKELKDNLNLIMKKS